MPAACNNETNELDSSFYSQKGDAMLFSDDFRLGLDMTRDR